MIGRRRKKGRPGKSWEECVKIELTQFGLKQKDVEDHEDGVSR